MKLKDVLQALVTPDLADDKEVPELLEMEVLFHSSDKDNMGLLSVYLDDDGRIAVDIGGT